MFFFCACLFFFNTLNLFGSEIMCFLYLRTLIPLLLSPHFLQLYKKDFYFIDSFLMGNHSDTLSDRSADVGPQRLEYRPYSNPENCESDRAESSVLSLTEHYVMNSAINHWEGPKYITYSTKDARLRSFVINDWPHGLNSAPNALCEAGLFFTGRNMHTLFNKVNSKYVF